MLSTIGQARASAVLEGRCDLICECEGLCLAGIILLESNNSVTLGACTSPFPHQACAHHTSVQIGGPSFMRSSFLCPMACSVSQRPFTVLCISGPHRRRAADLNPKNTQHNKEARNFEDTRCSAFCSDPGAACLPEPCTIWYPRPGDPHQSLGLASCIPHEKQTHLQPASSPHPHGWSFSSCSRPGSA